MKCYHQLSVDESVFHLSVSELISESPWGLGVMSHHTVAKDWSDGVGRNCGFLPPSTRPGYEGKSLAI